MDESSESARTSKVWRTIRFFDPAEPGFIWRMMKIGGLFALVGALALAMVGMLVAKTEQGRYTVAYALSISHQHEPALEWSTSLLEDYPDAGWEYYRMKAYNLRHLDRNEESLAIYDDALKLLPDAWWPHSHRCFYGSLLADPAAVMDSCDRSIEYEPTQPETAYERRAIARGLTGDLEGAAEDLQVAIGAYGAGGRYTYELDVRERWLREIQAGGNPFTEAEMAAELEHY